MNRSLPVRPNLAQLKHQAKDLLTAARLRERGAIATLRRITRFEKAGEEKIAAEISLSDVQYALATEYGFASWPALKKHIESLQKRPVIGPSFVRDENGATIVSGFETVRWGHATRRQNSVIAVLSLISEAFADDADYDFVMGASGAAFRVQVSLGQLCPSSPNATCGFDCMERAIQAWGREIEWLPTDDKHQANRTAARQRIVQNIDRGLPAIAAAEECDLLVGYKDEGLLLRQYSAREAGYSPMEKWPWQVGFVCEERRVADANKQLESSLVLAIELFETPTIGRYACGRHAYEHWMEQLEDNRRYAGLTSQELFPAALGNAVIFDGLADARGAASNYLHAFAETPGPVAAKLREAAGKCSQIELTLRANRRQTPYPWELPSIEQWTPDIRRAQAELLRHIAAIDGEVIRGLGAVIKVLQSQ
jgi:hypothetical protein